MALNAQIYRKVNETMVIKELEPFILGVETKLHFILRMETKVHPKEEEDRTGLSRAKEIETKINEMAGFDLCGSITNTVQPRSNEPECVTFLAKKEIKNFDVFTERLKKELGINFKYKKEFNN